MLQKPPQLPNPPPLYDARYLENVLRILYLYLQQGANQGPLIGTTLQLTDIPGSGAGLPAGSVWRNGDSLSVVLDSQAYAPSFSLGVRVGTVTVI